MGSSLSPEQVSASTEPPSSLVRTREARRLRINPLTGEYYERQDLYVPTDPGIREQAAKRYGLAKGDIPSSDDPIELARSLFPVAAKMLQRDGYHSPIVFLHHPDHGWHKRVVITEDKLDKFLGGGGMPKKWKTRAMTALCSLRKPGS